MKPPESQPEQFVSLKNQLFLMIIAPGIAMAIMLGCLAIYLHIQTLDQQFKQHGELLALSHAPQIQKLLNSASEQEKVQALQQLSNAMLNRSQIRSLTITLFESNKVLHTIHAGPKMRPRTTSTQRSIFHAFISPSEHFSLHLSENHIELLSAANYTNLSSSGSAPYTARLDLELDKNLLQLSKYSSIFIFLLLLFVALLISAYFAHINSNKISQPVQAISYAIARIREGKLSTRVKGLPVQGELNELVQGINSMAASLQDAHEEMQQSIDQATGDLRSTLETIEIQNIELDMARKEAVEASRIKSQFLANISHEIRTPLNSVIGFTNILLKSSLNETQKDQLETIQKSSDNLLAIINDILDFSKIEAGKLSLDIGSVNIRSVLEEVMEILSPMAREKNLKQILSIEEGVPEKILSDPLRIKQILTNLLNNAIKFSDRGTLHIRVSSESEHIQKNMLKISVSDQGIGLTENAKKRLFEAFHQSDSSNIRRFQGTGLGLSISRHLVEMLGGEIGVESMLGQGSTFWFTLPADTAITTRSLLHTKSQQLANKTNAAIDKPKILVVDDNAANLKLLCTLLSDLGLDHEASNNGRTAIELSKHYHHDLVFMDIQMPDLDGVATTVKIREFDQRFSRHRPIIALTAHAFDNEKEQLLKNGFDDCLTKPIMTDQLIQIIEYWTGYSCKNENKPANNLHQENTLRTININEGIRLAGSKPELADEMLAMLIEQLPEDKTIIIQTFSDNSKQQLLEKVHFIHGATRYCGVPLLRDAASKLESALKKDKQNIKSDVEKLLLCIDDLLAEYNTLSKPVHTTI